MKTEVENIYEWENEPPAPQVQPTDDADWKSIKQSKKHWEDELKSLKNDLQSLKAQIEPKLRKKIEETEVEIQTLDMLLSWSN